MAVPWGSPVGVFSQPIVVGPFTVYGTMPFWTRANGGSAAWPAANRAIYMPVRIPVPGLVQQVWWENGATVSGNVDLGLYDHVGTRLFSTGSTAQAGTSAKQAVDVADVLVGPGLFYLALACSSATATMINYDPASTLMAKFAGLYTQASAFALPATATFATPASGYVPYCALALRPVA